MAICSHTKLFTLLTVSWLAASSCTRDEPDAGPVIALSVTPDSGTTTQTFTFDLSKSESRSGKGIKLFTRWDWDGDGNWDTPFTKLLVYSHRYYAPGNWRPRLEMVNLDGIGDTMSLDVPVVQGYSPPKITLKLLPDKGHIFTDFLLDASATRDDEDSVKTLKYRWDFEGDGQWDIPFGDSAAIHHVYPETGFYQPRLQVRDPSGLISTGSADLSVNLEDTLLVAAFRCVPDSVTDLVNIRMDASASFDGNDRSNPLRYRWDWENDRIWDTGWLDSSATAHIFPGEGLVFVRLQVMSLRGLQNQTVNLIRVYHENRPPTANFSVSTLAGNTRTDFRFDGWWARDPESSPSELKFRWDWDGDGTWDTDYLATPALLHRFDRPGTYRITLEVTDPLGLKDTCFKVIGISRGTNETGMILDNRGLGYEYYGTVLIGNRWWFSRNLTIQDQSLFYRKYNEQYYFGYDSGPFRDYGLFYYFEVLPILCPEGWRVPSKTDWEDLFSQYPEDELYEALMPGGVSDFAATLGGEGNRKPPLAFEGIDVFGSYWSTTNPLDPTAYSTWMVKIDRSGRTVLRGYNPRGGMLYGVRCVKDR